MILTISCSESKENIQQNAFDTACNIFEEASQKQLPPIELGEYIEDKLKTMPEQTAKQDVIELYDALFQAAPSSRYQLFKDSAESVLKKEWECQSIKLLYDIK